MREYSDNERYQAAYEQGYFDALNETDPQIDPERIAALRPKNTEDELDELELQEAYYQGYQDAIADREAEERRRQESGRRDAAGSTAPTPARGSLWLGAGIGALVGAVGCVALWPRRIVGWEALLAAIAQAGVLWILFTGIGAGIGSWLGRRRNPSRSNAGRKR